MGTDTAVTPSVEEVALNKAISDNRDQAESNRRRINELLRQIEGRSPDDPERQLAQVEIERLDDEQLDLHADYLLLAEELEELEDRQEQP